MMVKSVRLPLLATPSPTPSKRLRAILRVTKGAVQKGQDGPVLPAPVAKQNTRFASTGPRTLLTT